MSGQNFIVPPRSWDDIDRIAQDFRSKLGLRDVPLFPVIEVLEHILDFKLGVNFFVRSKREMGAAEGGTDPNGKFIILREDVYQGACDGNGRDRFTVSHEIGHLVLHSGIPLARATPETTVKAYCLSEPQANQFAAALLMPAHFFTKSDTPELVKDRHGTSHEAARLRVERLRGKGLI